MYRARHADKRALSIAFEQAIESETDAVSHDPSYLAANDAESFEQKSQILPTLKRALFEDELATISRYMPGDAHWAS